MSKIGVVTLSNSIDNYGNVLQYLATQEFFNHRGHVTYLLHPHGHASRNIILDIPKRLLNRLVRILSNCVNSSKPSEQELQKKQIFKKWGEITKERELLHPRHFSKFREKYFKISEGTYEDLVDENYDVFCAGSDQTWSSVNECYMLGWVPDRYKKISFATSIGHKSFSHSEIEKVKRYLSSFNLITVRERNAMTLSKACGKDNAEIILDPTLLLNSCKYNKFASDKQKESKKPYVLVYMLGGEIELPIHQILTTIKEKGYEVKYVESQGRCEDEQKLYPTVEEWLTLVRDAEYIVTNSFHGMAFSIIYHKPFLVFPLVGIMSDMNIRIHDLSKYFNVENRIYSGDINILFEEMKWEEIDMKKEANYLKVDKLLKAQNL